jgi:Outer membrane protein beta-barrel domain
MTRKFYGILIVLAAATLSSTAMAAQTSSANSDFYVGGDLGLTDSGWSPTYNSTGFGFHMLGGYQLNSMWSVEGDFTHYADATKSGGGSISTNAFAGNVKFMLPIGHSKFSGFTKLGLANTFNSGDVSSSHLGLVMSYGVQLPILPNLDGVASYTHAIGKYGTTSSVPNTDFYGLGVIYRLPASLFA